MPDIVITFEPLLKNQAESLAEKLQLPLAESAKQTSFYLHLSAKHLALHITSSKQSPLFVDFLSGANYHRFRFGGGKNQLISRACGLKTLPAPTLIDLTGGLARDAFVLATLGAHVTFLERHPVIAALIEDGIQRAQQAGWFRSLELSFVHTDALSYVPKLATYPQVIYLDPMFPARTKSALVKKELRVLQQLIGPDNDSAELLHLACQYATERVVVKRPNAAPPLNNIPSDLCYRGRSTRFDVYLAKKKPS